MPKSYAVATVPPHVFFIVGALFHYFGPACAVLLFAHVAPLGVAWLRIATAALVFGAWRRPWRQIARMDARQLRLVIAMGVVLAAMNGCFYLAIARLPLATVGAIEFIGPIALAALGVRSARHLIALCLCAAGVYALTDAHFAIETLGYAFAFLNCALFTAYVVLGHQLAAAGAGVDRIGLAMLVAAAAALPFGIADAGPAFARPALLGAAAFVGVSSSVIPYVCDQLAMARLPRATFALLLSLLPATALVVGMIVLRQLPTATEGLGFAAVVGAVTLHGRAELRPRRSLPPGCSASRQ
jgi:inner membrane transporter RhtA